MANDTLGVSEFWSTTDYLGLKADQQHVKDKRARDAPHTSISKYVNPETAFVIRQVKSPRAADTGPEPSTKQNSIM